MAENQPEYKQIVRISHTDIYGDKNLLMALQRIKGVGSALSNSICNILNLDKTKLVGNITDKEIESVEALLKDPSRIPNWMYNRRKDYETGEDRHVINVDLKLSKDFDLKRMKKVKTYRGMRHSVGLPVRGQRTRGNFRKGKTLGVSRKSKPGKK